MRTSNNHSATVRGTRRGRVRWGLTAFLVLVFAAGAGLVWAAGSWLREPVEVERVERGRAVDAVPGVVEVSARHSAEIRSPEEGRVVESAVEAGRSVEEGGVLVRLDTAEIDGRIERVRMDLETEKALRDLGSPLRYELQDAEEEMERMRALYEQGEYSRGELAAQERKVAAVANEIEIERLRERRRIERLRNEREELERRRERMTVRAPMDGDVVEVYAYPGDVLAARAPLARLLSSDREVVASISEENFAGIRAGQPATVRFLSYGTRRFDGSVSRVLPAANPETQRYTVHLDVDMPHEMKIPGITGEVSIVLDEREEVLIVPRRALFGRQVFVVREGRAHLREVEPGFVSLTRVEIRSGLEEGETVVVENLDRLHDGDRVRVENRDEYP